MGILIFHQHATNSVPDHTITSSAAAHKKKKEKKEKKKDKILNGRAVDFVLMEVLPISYKRDLGEKCLNYKNWVQFEGY